MIVGQQKKAEEIIKMLGENWESLLIVGCGTCVTVSLAGGEREVEALANLLQLYYGKKGKKVTISTDTITRQCDFEFIDDIAEKIEDHDIILSLACGVGVQHMVERHPQKLIFPGLNTSFYGATTAVGEWAERCIGCGECILDRFGGVCPVARCSKSLLNGPCGGSQDGKCEVDDEIDCGWELIFNRMKDLDILEKLLVFEDPKDWQPYRDGGPRKLVNKEYYNE